MPATKKRPPNIKPHGYSKDLEELVIAYHKKHIAHSIKTLFYFLANCQEAGLSEESLRGVIEQYNDMPGFPLVYIMKMISSHADITAPPDLENVMKAF